MHRREPVFLVGQEDRQRLQRLLLIESNEERLQAHRVLELDQRLARVFVRFIVESRRNERRSAVSRRRPQVSLTDALVW
jgi:hypothetical protein